MSWVAQLNENERHFWYECLTEAAKRNDEELKQYCLENLNKLNNYE